MTGTGIISITRWHNSDSHKEVLQKHYPNGLKPCSFTLPESDAYVRDMLKIAKNMDRQQFTLTLVRVNQGKISPTVVIAIWNELIGEDGFL